MTDLDAEQAYRRLQQRARSEGRGTEELLVLYAHEGFLRRLSVSAHRDRLVLKGGMLLAALDTRRPTRDADLSAHGVPNDDASVRALVTGIAQIDAADGLSFDTTTIATRTMREDANPALLDDQDIALLGYPVELVLAEKIATMMRRGQANTRDRDFADVVQLSRVHPIDAHTLRGALHRTADHRKQPMSALADTLDGHAAARQAPWTTIRAGRAVTRLQRWATAAEADADEPESTSAPQT